MFVLLLTIAIVFLDQVTKYAVMSHLSLGEIRPVIEGFLNLTYVRNTGAAWGMMSGFNVWLTALSVVMLALIVVFRRSFLNDTWPHRLALGLMLGGIIGNLLDRVRLFSVVDFLDFHWGAHYHFPSFNVADAAICVGVALYILSSALPAAARGSQPPPAADVC
jgi:signal peptidase II